MTIIETKANISNNLYLPYQQKIPIPEEMEFLEYDRRVRKIIIHGDVADNLQWFNLFYGSTYMGRVYIHDLTAGGGVPSGECYKPHDSTLVCPKYQRISLVPAQLPGSAYNVKVVIDQEELV